MRKHILPCLLAALFLLSGCRSDPSAFSLPSADQTAASSAPAVDTEAATDIHLSDDEILVDGQTVSTDEASAVYTANDIVFYLAGQDFTYGEGTEADEHQQAEADEHTVVHITQPGTYRLSGSLSAGQIAVDLGDDAEEDPNAVVNLILDGVDITCTVAPGIIFYNVFECGNKDEAAYDVDTTAAGANVIIADDSVNTVNGSYVARIYKPDSVVLSEDGTEVTDSKKLHKYDAAFYSKMTMNVFGGETGDGVLNINAENEGLDSELHLTLNGGNINITSGNDGINTNEDGVSVTTINGGNLTILVNGSTGEGDGIDSNGWLVINGGTITSAACGFSGDAGIDSDMGIYLNGGTVAASGNMLDQIAGGGQTYAVFRFAQTQTGGSSYTLKDSEGSEVFRCAPVNDFSYLILAGDFLTPGDYSLWQDETQLAGSSGNAGGMGGFGGQKPENGELPEDMQRPEGELPGGMERPDGEMPEGELPEDMEFPEGEMPEGGHGQGGRPNGNFGGGMGGPGEISTTFTIVAGGNSFTMVG